MLVKTAALLHLLEEAGMCTAGIGEYIKGRKISLEQVAKLARMMNEEKKKKCKSKRGKMETGGDGENVKDVKMAEGDVNSLVKDSDTVTEMEIVENINEKDHVEEEKEKEKEKKGKEQEVVEKDVVEEDDEDNNDDGDEDDDDDDDDDVELQFQPTRPEEKVGVTVLMMLCGVLLRSGVLTEHYGRLMKEIEMEKQWRSKTSTSTSSASSPASSSTSPPSRSMLLDVLVEVCCDLVGSTPLFAEFHRMTESEVCPSITICVLYTYIYICTYICVCGGG